MCRLHDCAGALQGAKVGAAFGLLLFCARFGSIYPTLCALVKSDNSTTVEHVQSDCIGGFVFLWVVFVMVPLILIGMLVSLCIRNGCCKTTCKDDCKWMVAMDLTFDRNKSSLFVILLFLNLGVW